jgi:uncharacterized protein YdeI (BOF family)
MEERRGASPEARAAAIANAQLPTPDIAGRSTRTQVVAPKKEVAEEEVPLTLSRRPEPAIFRDESAQSRINISGPSFLGLNAQPQGNNDVEYLLEDEPSGGGLRKLLLLVILAAIIGLVFVQWRSSFKANPKPAPAKADPSTPAPAPEGSIQPHDSAPTGEPSVEAAKVIANGANTVLTGAAFESLGAQAKPATLETTSADSSPSSSTENSADAKTPNAAEASNVSKAAEEARLPDYKPSAALVRAQQYIRGTGVQQNCEQGLLYLRAATDKNDPGAAIQMGALYSSGVCVKQDRVMAYRWFNSAHELQPANMWIQKNMDALWAQMSSQERRLAGY